MDIINFFTRRKSNDVSTVFNSEKTAISAEHAYQKSQFGCLKTDKELLEEFFEKVRDMIAEKNMHGKFCGMLEVMSDIIPFLPKIVEKLTRELGYKVVVLDDDCEITSKRTNETVNMKTGTTFLVLIWSKEAVKDVSERNHSYIKAEELEIAENGDK